MHENTPHDAGAPHLLEAAHAAVRDRDLEQASAHLERALTVDFDSDDVLAAMKYVKFWRERERQIAGISHAYERGQFFLDQWPVFDEFAARASHVCEPCMQSVRQYAFGSALAAFESMLTDNDTADAGLLMRIGRCHKGLGSYDRAVQYLEASAADQSEDAEIVAELADAYALVNEMQAAKVFFREAFFLDPQRVHLEELESQLIRALADRVAEQGFERAELLEWVPVYGVLLGVLNVKRELRSIEYGKLKQSIYALERELRDGRTPKSVVEPRLINRYFWLIDHYLATREDPAKVDEVLLKLRAVNERIYRQYTN